MRVTTSQLEPGCLLTSDVMGRTNRPIVPKNTTLQPVHIDVLKKFGVEAVEVSNRRSDGSLFIASEPTEQEGHGPVARTEDPLLPFSESYLAAVQEYKKWFLSWQGGSPLNISAIRKVMVPLLERVVDAAGHEVFSLHHFTSSRDYIYHHSVAMGLLSSYLASKMGYNYGDWIQVGLAGLLADSGMAKISERITWKETPLTEKEYEMVKNHPTYGYRNVEKISSLSNHAKVAILQHHERLDGTGYPLGARQSKIHPFSQIIAVCDMYHAMTSERMYRRKQSPYKVLEEILQEQFGRYDHKVISALVKEMTSYSTGTRIRLSDHREAEVIFVEKTNPTRPLVRIIEDGQILPLNEHLDLHIEDVYE